MVYRTSFSGLDGSGKSTAIDLISNKLANCGYKILHAGRPFFIDKPGDEREFFFCRFSKTIDYLHRLADENNLKTAVGIVNVAYGRIRSLIEEKSIVKHNPDLIILGRDFVLDPSVYSHYYFPFTKNLNYKTKRKLISFLSHSIKSDLTFYLDIDPIIAYERILMRMESEKSEDKKARKKWPHMHENLDDLKFLRDEFEKNLEILVKENGREIVKIDASKPRNELVNEMFSIIRNKLI